jgi:hypothetical protein
LLIGKIAKAVGSREPTAMDHISKKDKDKPLAGK